MARTLTRRQAMAVGALALPRSWPAAPAWSRRGCGWRPGPADDPFGMLLEELVPLLSGVGLRTGPAPVPGRRLHQVTDGTAAR